MRKRRRIIDAMVELTAEKGYEATKIADIVRRAGVARKTLYDNFDGKEEVFLAAFDGAVAAAVNGVEEACSGGGEEWADRVAAGLRAFLTHVAANPAASRMCLVEAMSAMPAAAARYDAAVEQFVDLLRKSAPADPGRPGTVEETLVGGVAWVVHRQIRREGAARALDLMPDLLDFLLFPYRGVARPGGESDSAVANFMSNGETSPREAWPLSRVRRL